ncbi:ABC transporter substrate-binding protein [Agrobacterium genomosp. 13]|uniref:Iron complex transport system substrate-binding protein n=1 Tax=Agrobacterium genomosp. 13 str. CFBP 6927 TaxID=1183428 RepID=A0ABM9VI65_9HYPH|nr:ABC transporter substrate-binding protein [Agrobacterium genomosp. 13]CUX43866.1 Iron complex transport system substrate-binding protein [Agrobacterium genomosp. 13 str. CFBP 6927]
MMLHSCLSRRALLCGTVSLFLTHRPSSAACSGGIVAMDWVSGQNLLALGVQPVAMPELERYASLVVEPALSPLVAELGLRSEPNLELVDHLRPCMIVHSDDFSMAAGRLNSIAPIHFFDAGVTAGEDHLISGRNALMTLAARIGDPGRFDAFEESFNAEIRQARARLSSYDGRPLLLATVIDGRRLLVFGRNSLFQNVLDQFGIKNAWDGYTSQYGHTTVTADQLSRYPQARLLCIGDTSSEKLDTLLAGPVMKSLPFIRENRLVRIEDVLFYGGLPPAKRFARLVATALAGEASQ